jgi:hypothetical protein
MEIQDWRMLRNLLLIFGIILLAGGIYVAFTAGTHEFNSSWTTARALQLAYNGWDIFLLIVGACLVSSAVIFHFRVKEEERLS